MKQLSCRDMRDIVKDLDAALEQTSEGKGDPLALIEFVRDRVEDALNANPVRDYALELIEQGRHEKGGDASGTNILNHVSYVDVHHADQLTARAAFNEARHTPAFAAYLATELDGRMFDDSFGDWNEIGTPALALSAFGQYMASVVQIELDQRATWGSRASRARLT